MPTYASSMRRLVAILLAAAEPDGLRDKGVVTQVEYDERRTAILGAL